MVGTKSSPIYSSKDIFGSLNILWYICKKLVHMTMIEILDETANFYNTGNRSIDSGLFCQYNGVNGRKCAFARCVEDDKLSLLIENENAKFIYLPYLKPEYQGHGITFWRDIQMLHDNDKNWNKNGLTKRGIAHYNRIVGYINKHYN